MPINRKFRKRVRDALDNKPLRTALDNFAHAYPQAREDAYKGIDFENLRDEIERIKTNSIENIEELADQFERKITGRGGGFHRAADGEEVVRIIKEIAQQRNARLCVKSKSMTSEEIHLNHHLEDALKVVETDLGEWIIQQIDERPSHMVMPAIHLTREKCAEIFSSVLGTEVEPDIPRMVKLAREILRAEFLEADIGITGCNIAVAETGTMVIFTNEGNGRLTATLPPVHIVLLGYEKLVARFKDIAAPTTAIPRSATCQLLTSYVTMISGPSETFAGPGKNGIVQKELHVILLDNGRRELLKDPVFKKIGQCIRCASCLNVCPVYGLVGGQVYGDVYAGGIGALLTNLLNPSIKSFVGGPGGRFFKRAPLVAEGNAEKIQELCLDCGKCRETCPGKIDIPGLILQLRPHIRKKIPPPFLWKIIIDKVLPHKKMFDISMKAAAPGICFFSPLPKPVPKSFSTVFKNFNQRIDDQKGTIAFFYGCMIDYIYPEIGESIILLLNRAGYRVVLPKQKCCGAPALYTGLEENAKKMARDNLVYFGEDMEFYNYDYIVTACPTGTVMIKKEWQRLISGDLAVVSTAKKMADKTVAFIQLFHQMQNKGLFHANKQRVPKERSIAVTYHCSCHLKRELGIEKEPRGVLFAVPRVKWIEMNEADRCCGFAGTYSLKLPEISSELLKRKIKNIENSGAEIVLVDCPGCLLSLRQGLKAVNSKIKAHHSAVFIASDGTPP